MGRIDPPPSIPSWRASSDRGLAPFQQAFEKSGFVVRLGEALSEVLGESVLVQYWVSVLESPRYSRANVPAAASKLGPLKDRRAVGPLITRLRSEPVDVMLVIASALKEITGKDLGLDWQAWAEWWKAEEAASHH